MRIFDCHCGATIFFDNTRCLACQRELGYLPNEHTLSSLEPGEGIDVWRALAGHPDSNLYRKCRNYADENVCNWMVPKDDPSPFCVACRLNDTIPQLDHAANRVYWATLEASKRYLVYSLLELGLPLTAKSDDATHGLAFAFLADQLPTSPLPTDPPANPPPKVLTGHNAGLITINVAEADEIEREQARRQMHESYRTLLGHFRHESGHYYWDRLVAGTSWQERGRELFGDDTVDYGEALKRYYAEGPAPDWQTRFISAYASAHPWEDWAETWAHYLHMIDTLETSKAFGISSRQSADDIISRRLFEGTDYGRPSMLAPSSFQALVRDWVWLSLAINAVNRSMGMRDAYPFILNKPIADKLEFVHDVIRSSQPARSNESAR
jgi:hypothetical protein